MDNVLYIQRAKAYQWYTYLSTSLFVYLLPTYPSIHPSMFSSTHPSTYPSIHVPIKSSTHLFHLSFYPSFAIALLFFPFFHSDGYIFTRSDGPYLGKVYKKVRYHQYTDETFTTKIERNDTYLGILGPLIMAETYDTIRVLFKNKASRPYSIHAQVIVMPF